MSRGNDPDETEGRALYRAKADALASAQVAYGRRRVALHRCEECGASAIDRDQRICEGCKAYREHQS